MFGVDWFTIVVIGIFTLLFWGIHERNKNTPYNPSKKNGMHYHLNRLNDDSHDKTYNSLYAIFDRNIWHQNFYDD